MVHIDVYKDHRIEYSDKKFKVVKDKQVIAECGSEDEARMRIDNLERTMAEYKEKEMKEVARLELERMEQKKKEALAKEQAKFRAECQGYQFRDIIRMVHNLTSEARLVFDTKTLTITARHPAMVSMAGVSMPVKCKHPTSFAVNVNVLYKVFQKAKCGKDDIVLKLVDDHLSISNGFGVIKVTLIKDYEMRDKLPELKYVMCTKFKVTKKEFFRDVNLATALKDSGDTIKFEVCDLVKAGYSQVYLSRETEHAQFRKRIAQNIPAQVEFKVKYSISYLVLGAALPGKELTIEIAKDYPITMTDELGNKLIIAPRVDNDK